MPVSTLLAVVLLVLAVVFGVLGFAQSTNSQVAVGAISLYLVVSALCFVGITVIQIRKEPPLQRFLGVAAGMAALYMVIMAVIFFQTLNTVVQPTF